ncbi:unnamed protein product [Citrullus colocynthis]|uniref:Uncharacterized protein n=1 Tax=Citrullus colocynthis TaxID=252529 RepID=A0ABP0Y7I6_9ROSI
MYSLLFASNHGLSLSLHFMNCKMKNELIEISFQKSILLEASSRLFCFNGRAITKNYDKCAIGVVLFRGLDSSSVVVIACCHLVDSGAAPWNVYKRHFCIK